MNVYDASAVTVTADGIFTTGFAEGSMVEFSKDEDNISTKVDAQGVVGVAKRNNTLGTITVTLAQTSPSLAQYTKLANTSKVISFWVQGGSEKVGGTEAIVKKPADGTFSDEIEDREFEVQVLDYTVTPI